ncbi:FAD-binding oxidoreductase [Acuticoccus mangrovi]|uniref:FAD-binding oxidoreductase n=1 Tax=Acuticoccus mangrovi TaxID=2796142 RepID=A0A934ISL1_9HYPH|nr:FAD-binding oxidoreductase [Acuticoccus mangrovi]MBJ3776904.1 FAD-binding oxidoreductase [Acuticoccus mangrovi]
MNHPAAVPTASRENVLEGLADIVGARHVLSDPNDTEPFYEDWLHRTKGDALCVCQPADTAEVAAVVAFCAARGLPVFPQAGNTSSCGGSVPLPASGGVLLSVRRLNRVERVDPQNNAIIAGAGCVLADLKAAAAAEGRLFPLTLSSEGSCQIGGNVSTNAGGTAVLRYGTMRDLVLGLEVVLADGRIWDGLRTLRKDNTGYDMKALFVGSEGTLGIVTRVALKLFPLPTLQATALVAVASADDAAALLRHCHGELGSSLDAFELLSASQLDIVCRHVPGNRNPLPGHPWYVLVDLQSAERSQDLTARLEAAIAGALEDGIVADAVVAQSGAQIEDIWRLRHSVSESNRRHGLNFTHDVGVPIAQIPEFLHRADAAVAEAFAQAEVFCVSHMGDGNVHYTVTFAHDTAEPAALGARVTGMVHDIAMSLGGTFGAEHGVGQRYRASLRRYKSPVELDLFRSMKSALDPNGILNPGKVL